MKIRDINVVKNLSISISNHTKKLKNDGGT